MMQRLNGKTKPVIKSLCGLTGETAPDTIDRALRFALQEAIRFQQRKEYGGLIAKYGESTKRKFTK